MQREDEFTDMDANVRARDERVRELTEVLSRPVPLPESIYRSQLPHKSVNLSSTVINISSKIEWELTFAKRICKHFV